MKIEGYYSYSPKISKKEFAFEVIEILKSKHLPYDIFSMEIKSVSLKTRSALLISGKGEVSVVCSLGEYVRVGENHNGTVVYRPFNTTIKGYGVGILPLEEDKPVSYKGDILDLIGKSEKLDKDYKIIKVMEKYLVEALRKNIFDKNFSSPSSLIKGVSLSGMPEIEDVYLLELPYYEMKMTYKNVDITVSGLAIAKETREIKGLDDIPASDVEKDVQEAVKIKSQIPKFMYLLASIPALTIFVFFYLMIQSIGKDQDMLLTSSIVLGAATAVFFIFVIYTMMKKRHAKEYGQKLLDEYKEISNKQLDELKKEIEKIL